MPPGEGQTAFAGQTPVGLRQLFLPFVDLLKHYTDIVSLDSPTDYRMEKTKSLPVWLTRRLSLEGRGGVEPHRV